MTHHELDQPEPHPFDGKFEAAAEAVSKSNTYIPLPEIAQASIAISLKRIADMMEDVKTDPYLFSIAAENAGQAFELGKRGR